MRNAFIAALSLAVLTFAVGCKGNLKSSNCTPECSGKQCGDDGCGGTCGECSPGNMCDIGGQCVSAFCGNGRLEGNEECDFAIASGPGACETECTDDGNACTSEEFFGNAQDCDATCRRTTIGECITGDGCCPGPGCMGSDGDCSLTCDDGTIDDNETCDPVSSCPTDPATDCPVPADACMTAIVTGSPDTCSALCSTEEIEECIDDDGCCPSDCGVDEDNDCEFVCGDGMVTGPEACDNMIPAGEEGACPAVAADCDDAMECTSDEIQGMAADCSAACVNVTITDPTNGDGCCPPNATPDNDDDCTAVCGNNIVETGETCDNAIVAPTAGFCPAAADCDDADACTTDVYSGDAALCTAECANDPVMMPVAADGCCYFAGTVAAEIADCQSLCDDYCTMATTFCVDYDGAGTSLFNDDNASGDAMDECQTACAAFQFTIRQDASVAPADDDGFDTMFCRIYHLGLADPNVDAMGPMTHCPHAEAVSPVCNTAP